MTKRPTVRFGERQYQLIQEKLKERGITFQRYCVELICADLGIPPKEFEMISDDRQISLFDELEE